MNPTMRTDMEDLEHDMDHFQNTFQRPGEPRNWELHDAMQAMFEEMNRFREAMKAAEEGRDTRW